MILRRNSVAKHFSKRDLDGIKWAVSRVEKNTSAEIRVKIIPRMHREAGGDIHKQAVHEFFHEGMAKTRDHTGVLILVALQDRQFQILADTGIMAKVTQKTLDDTAQVLADAFKEGAYTAGVVATLCALGPILAAEFPRKSDETNELPDDVITR